MYLLKMFRHKRDGSFFRPQLGKNMNFYIINNKKKKLNHTHDLKRQKEPKISNYFFDFSYATAITCKWQMGHMHARAAWMLVLWGPMWRMGTFKCNSRFFSTRKILTILFFELGKILRPSPPWSNKFNYQQSFLVLLLQIMCIEFP